LAEIGEIITDIAGFRAAARRGALGVGVPHALQVLPAFTLWCDPEGRRVATGERQSQGTNSQC